MENYVNLWEVVDDCRDSDIKARTLGVQTQMKKFDFFFGLSIGVLVLSHTDSLSEAIQKKTLTASEAQGTAAMTVKTLSLLRNEEMWTMFWKKLELSDRWKSCKQSYIATATQGTPQIRGLHRWKSNA